MKAFFYYYNIKASALMTMAYSILNVQCKHETININMDKNIECY